MKTGRSKKMMERQKKSEQSEASVGGVEQNDQREREYSGEWGSSGDRG